MQLHDKTAYVWCLRYRWDPSLSRNPVPWFPHFMPPCMTAEQTFAWLSRYRKILNSMTKVQADPTRLWKVNLYNLLYNLKWNSLLIMILYFRFIFISSSTASWLEEMLTQPVNTSWADGQSYHPWRSTARRRHKSQHEFQFLQSHICNTQIQIIAKWGITSVGACRIFLEYIHSPASSVGRAWDS